jgi:hypothetical protein
MNLASAALILLAEREQNSVMMAVSINLRAEFRELREKWGPLTAHQIYAAMSTLRSKIDPAFNAIEPTTGFPGRRVFYRLTDYGREIAGTLRDKAEFVHRQPRRYHRRNRER